MLAVLIALLTMLLLNSGDGAKTELEARISRTLCGVEGAGRVEVTIRMQEKEEAGGALGMARKVQNSTPCGAVAVAQGADDPWVAIQLQEALCALLGLAPNAVSVIAGGE